jgi:hypothetical protein
MRSIKKMLLLGAAALMVAAFVAPAAASASNWTKNGVELQGYTWSQEGKTLEGSGSLALSGTAKFGLGGGLGAVECPLSAGASLQAEKSGKLSEVVISPAGCKATGYIAPYCTVSSVSAPSQPWGVGIAESAGKPVISTNAEVTLLLHFSGSECPPNWMLTGKLSMSPDKADAIGSVSLSGTFQTYIEEKGTYLKIGPGPASGTLSASPAGKYGITKQRTVAVTGNLGWEDTAYGSMNCAVAGTIALEPGSEGKLTALKTTSCEFVGYIKFLCGNLPVTFNSLPWTVVDQGSSIAIKGISISVWSGGCGFEAPFLGELQATPNSQTAVSYTNLSGTLKTGLTSMKWTGKLNWTPAETYGL